MEEPTATVETPTPEPVPETTPSEAQEETQVQAEPQESPKPAEEQPSRSQERIRETIAAKKEAERLALEKSQEADYWKAQALANRPQPAEELEGVTEEGIDPVKFAQSLESRILNQIKKDQGLTAAEHKALQEQLEVSSQPEMKDEFFRDYAVNYAKANGVSPWEAFEVAKERFEEMARKASASSKARDEAGKFVREETSSPSAGRGTSSASSYFTRSQIDSMSLAEYEKNREEINRQMQTGLIK